MRVVAVGIPIIKTAYECVKSTAIFCSNGSYYAVHDSPELEFKVGDVCYSPTNSYMWELLRDFDEFGYASKLEYYLSAGE
jgi:hypothetical protein